jgi:uncharacterized protein (DUF1697 family)
MKTYIALLRGINVSGHRLIKMDLLRKSCESLGLKDVTTYLQSGNVIFISEDKEPAELATSITRQIEKDFGFNVPVLALSVGNLKQIIDGNLLAKDNQRDHAFLHVTFLHSKPDKVDLRSIEEKKLEGEEISFTDRAVYLYCPKGYGSTKLNNSFLEARLKVEATTRNWKTTNELLRTATSVLLN